MTLVQLRHLLLLETCRSFRRAAEAACLTQPALSRSIRALEDELGGALFDRIGHHIEPTPLGSQLLPLARAVCDGADVLSDTASQLVHGTKGVVSLGLGSAPAALLMTPLLLFVAEQLPGLRLEVTRTDPQRMIKALRERTLDGLLVDSRSVPLDDDLSIEPVSTMHAAFLCRRGHPLLRRRSRAITLTDLKRYHVACTFLADEAQRMLVQHYGPEGHPHALFNLQCGELGSLLDLARQSDAVVLAVRSTAPDLVEIPVTPAAPLTAKFCWVTLAGRTPPQALPRLRTFMVERMRDPPPTRSLKSRYIAP